MVARGFGITATVLADLLRRPKSAAKRARLFAAGTLDERFDLSSPIPEIESTLLEKIMSHEIVLPPPTLLATGNQSVNGLMFLASLIQSLDAAQIFEIGTYNGVTAWCLARNSRSGASVATLDLPPEDEPALPLGVSDQSNRREFPTKSYPLPEYSGIVQQYWGDSATFNFGPWKCQCDLVYVDGAHSAPYVESDTDNALQMITSNGVVIWDDYTRRIAGVKSVLDSIEEKSLYRVPHSRLVIHLTDGAIEKINNSPGSVFLKQR